MSSPRLTIRLAQIRDLARITAVCLAALPDDPTFKFLWRHAPQYPEDSYFFWLQKFKDDLYNPKNTFLVAVESADGCDEKASGQARETIVAFAVWERNGAGPYAPFGSLLGGGTWNVMHGKQT